jgi:transposase-like protein
MAQDHTIPALATCPACKRVMEIKSVTPKLRGTADTIEYVCPHCGTTQRRTTLRVDYEEKWSA